jgi:hypothetical protein
MGHTSPENLKDLQTVLDRIREWSGIKEKSDGIFYYKSTPFLHFHDKDGKRWADVRAGKEWGTALDIPFNSSSEEQDIFLEEVQRRYSCLATPPGRK